MSEIVTWSGKLVVTGAGMVTPVGLGAASSLAALRAGISRLGEIPWFNIAGPTGKPQPVTGATVPRVPGNRFGPARLERLIEHALRDTVTSAGLKRHTRCAVFLGTAAPRQGGRVLPAQESLRANVSAALSEHVTVEEVRLIEAGRAGALRALREAAAKLAQSPEIDCVLVGGADSMVSPLTLMGLHSKQRLRDGKRSTGILPGEGAGFVVLEKPDIAARRRAQVLAFVEAAAGGVDPTPPGKPNRAQVLANVLRALVGSVRTSPPLFISDLNGERHRGQEWMFASTRTPFYHGGSKHWLASESIGDAGAALGAVGLAWGTAALSKAYAPANEIVVWGASDEGAREAVVLKSATKAA